MIILTDSSTAEEAIMAYTIMPRYGSNLEAFFEKEGSYLSNSSIRKVALSTIDMLEGVHSAGYTYNDLKLDNIMVGYNNKPIKGCKFDAFQNTSLHLIDFGFATRFADKSTGKHLPQSDVDTFRGNMIFGSLNQLNFK